MTKCPICNKTGFKGKAGLAQHKRQVHPDPPGKPPEAGMQSSGNEVEIKQMISSWEISEKQKFYEFCKCNLEKEKNIMCKIILLDYINLTEEKKIKKLKLSFLSKKISGFEVLNMISIIAFQILTFYVADIY